MWRCFARPHVDKVDFMKTPKSKLPVREVLAEIDQALQQEEQEAEQENDVAYARNHIWSESGLGYVDCNKGYARSQGLPLTPTMLARLRTIRKNKKSRA